MRRIQRMGTMASTALIAFSSLLTIGFAGVAHAAAFTCTWTGTGGNLNFSTAANWSGCNGAAPVPSDFDNLVFNIQSATSNVYNPNNDITSLTVNNITIMGTSSSGFGVSLMGNPITLSGGVTNSTVLGSNSIPSGFQTILIISGNQTFSTVGQTYFQEVQGSGNITVSGGGTADFTGTGISQALSSYTGTIASTDSVIGLSTYTNVVSTGSVAVSGTATLDLFDENGGKAPLSVTYNLPISLGGTGIGKWGALNLDGGQDSDVTNVLAGPLTLTSNVQVTAAGGNAMNITGAVAYGGFSLSSAGANVTTITIPAGANRSTVNSTVGNNVTYVVDGSLGATVVGSGGILKGAGGTLSSLVLNSGGTVSPGHSPGCLTVSGNLSGNGTYQEEIQAPGATACTDFDAITVSGTVDLTGSTLDPILLSSFVPTVGQSYKMIDNQGTSPVTGTFNGLAEGATFAVGSSKLQITYKGGDGNDVVLTVVDPATAATAVLPKTPDTGFGLSIANPAVILLVTSMAAATILVIARRNRIAASRR